MSKSSKQYLERYAASETQLLSNWPAKFHQAMLIPAKDEAFQLIDNCRHFLEQQGNTLLVLIINQANNTNATASNKDLWERGMESGDILWRQDHLCLIGWENDSAVLLVDRFSNGLQLPPKEGVGLARKIAADIICQLIANQFISQPWIYSSDADCHWPANYFSLEKNKDCSQNHTSQYNKSKKIVAAHFGFHHCNSKDSQITPADRHTINTATALYEKSLHYYREGLQWANSPFDFYTIGSCLRIRYDAYCQVRGFPCRAAGEDFYLLNKLAKLGSIDFLDTQIIEIESRISQRAPFGTGPAVLDIIKRKASAESLNTYHPKCFAELKTLLGNSEELVHQDPEKSDISKSLCALGVKKFKTHLKQQNCSSEQFEKEFHTWFDGFRTLKFIHYMRDNVYSSIPLAEAMDQLLRWKLSTLEQDAAHNNIATTTENPLQQ